MVQSVGNTSALSGLSGIKSDYKSHQYVDMNLKNDSFDISKSNSEQKVTFKEGAKLVGKGFLNKVKDMAKAIVKHPLKTIGAIAATSLALTALPLIGISTVAGAAALAIGFAGIAVGKTATHTIKAIKHNKNGEYNEVRKDLGNIGGDCVDLALSMPFLPKAIKNLNRNIKYAPKIAFDKELWTNLKNTKGLGNKYTELLKANTKINYETMANEMGLKVKPKLVFDATMPSDPTKMVMAGEYEPTTGVLKINPNCLNPKMKFLLQTDVESIMKHELTHFQQFADIARTEGMGVEGLQNLLTEYYTNATKIGGLPKANLELAENMLRGDKSVFNGEFYQNIIDKTGKISAGSQEAALAKTYADGLIAKVTTQVDEINNLHIGFFPTKKDMKNVLEIYKRNQLEKPAYAAQDKFTADFVKFRPGVGKDSMMAWGQTSTDKKA